jgi:hypothetical protein
VTKKEKERWERILFGVYKELNHRYFNDSVFVQRVRIGRFARDMMFDARLMERITWGLFLCNKESSVNEIIINQFLFKDEYLKHYKWIPEVIVHHEMSHAMVNLNTHPYRNGILLEQDHGPEWQKWMNLHPDAKAADYTLQGHLRDVILQDMYEFFVKFRKNNPDKELQLRWDY